MFKDCRFKLKILSLPTTQFSQRSRVQPRQQRKVKDESRARAILSNHKTVYVFTHQLVEGLEIVRDDLRLRSVYETGLFLVLVVGLLVVGAVRRLVLGGDLAIDLPLHLHQQRREHAELGAATRDLEEAQYHVSLVLTHNQILGLEEQALDDAEAVAAPVDEVGDVVAGEESAGLGVRQVGHVTYLAHRQRQGGYRACHRHFAGLTSRHVVARVFPHVVRMLEAEKEIPGQSIVSAAEVEVACNLPPRIR